MVPAFEILALNACGKHMLFMLKLMTDEYTCIGIRMAIHVMKDGRIAVMTIGLTAKALSCLAFHTIGLFSR